MELRKLTFATAPIDRTIDVGIITVIPTEVSALFKVFGIDPSHAADITRPLDYWESKLYSVRCNRDLRLVLTFISGTAGNTDSAITTAFFLRDWQPRMLCLTGIAAGVAGKVKIGDVVFPDKIHDVCVTVVSEEDGGELPRDDIRHRDSTLERMLKVAPASSATLNDELAILLPNIASLQQAASEAGLSPNEYSGRFTIHDGSIVSGNRLLRDAGYLADIRWTKDEKCRAGEMEGAGFARACESDSLPWLVVRGISDFGDRRKSDRFQELAAHAAATALRQVLSSCIDMDKLPHHIPGAAYDAILGSNIVEELLQAYAAERWEQTVLIGTFLSRPFWLSGRYELRRRLGALIEDAAAKCGRTTDRARSLIDDLGWTSFVLGDAPSALKNIKDGLALARADKSYYLVAKAERHLASISRRGGDLHVAQKHLTRAKSAAARIRDDLDREEMITSLMASEAQVLLERSRPDDAIKLLEKAKRGYEEARDNGRAVKIYYLLGRTHEARNAIEAARQTYLEGYHVAQGIGRKDELLKNAKALADLAATAGDRDTAQEWYRSAISHAYALNRFDDMRAMTLQMERL